METTKNKQYVSIIRQKLIDNNFGDYARLLDKYIKDEGSCFKLAVVGEILKGKSTLINKLIDNDLLDTSIIPTDCQITIKKGEADKIIYDSGSKEAPVADFLDIADLFDNMVIKANLPYFEKNNIEITEFPGLASIKKADDFLELGEIYNANGAVLVISAEQLLSMTESNFIKGFNKYSSSEKLLVVINKLSLLPEGELYRVLDYLENKVSVRFPNTKFALLDSDKNISKDNITSGISEIRNIISSWPEDNSSQLQSDALENIVGYIKSRLIEKRNDLAASINMGRDEINRKNEKIQQEKSYAETKADSAALDFLLKKNPAEKGIDEFISKGLTDIEKKLSKAFDASDDKLSWYKNRLNVLWTNEVSKLSDKAEAYIEKIICDDVKWLNDILETEILPQKIKIVIKDRKLSVSYDFEEQNEYKKYMKYIPIGIGGSVIIGFCLFNIIGAAVCLGGSVLITNFLNNLRNEKEAAQYNIIKEGFISEIESAKPKIISEAKKDVGSIYDNIANTFKAEAISIIDANYQSIPYNPENEAALSSIDDIINIL